MTRCITIDRYINSAEDLTKIGLQLLKEELGKLAAAQKHFKTNKLNNLKLFYCICKIERGKP